MHLLSVRKALEGVVMLRKQKKLKLISKFIVEKKHFSVTDKNTTIYGQK